MTTVTITRHFSGFRNVADSFSVGDMEHEGNASVSRYRLPDGYEVVGDIIYDSASISCEIVASQDGLVLVSRAGKCRDERLLPVS